MSKPLVSVVMAVHNNERYIAESIDGVLEQTYKNWELIVVDDASTDDSLKIARKYASEDSRIRTICLEECTLGGACFHIALPTK